MYLGFVINSTYPLLKTIKLSEIESYKGLGSILIVGLESASSYYPELDLNSKIISEQDKIYYCFSETESKEKYEEAIQNFISSCFTEFTLNYKIKNKLLTSLNELKLQEGRIFLYEDSICITITYGNSIYYINKQLYWFFNFSFITQEVIIEHFKSNHQVQFISWTCSKFFEAYLKSYNTHISCQDLITHLSLYGDATLYIGAICLKWLERLEEQEIDPQELSTWQKAYEVESYLSKCKVKLNLDKALDVLEESENSVVQSMVSNSSNGYLYSNYNGTNKRTGRIYSTNNGYSLQTLSGNLKSLIIAETNSYLVQLDYNYFEFSLIYQLLNLDVKEDPHLLMSNLVFGDDLHRKEGKSINYGLLYGQSVENTLNELYKENSINVEREELKRKLNELLEPINILKKNLTEEYKANGCIKNYFHRTIVPEEEYKCLNNYIQSTAADFLIRKILLLQDVLEQYNTQNYLLLQNHDSLLFNLIRKDVEETQLVELIIEVMENDEDGLTGTVELTYGNTWEECK